MHPSPSLLITNIRAYQRVTLTHLHYRHHFVGGFPYELYIICYFNSSWRLQINRMELSDERLCWWNFIHSFTSSEWDGTSKLKLFSLMNFKEHLSTTKTRHLSVSEDTDGAEFYCDENSTLNHQCSHSRFLHIHILKTRSLTFNTR